MTAHISAHDESPHVVQIVGCACGQGEKDSRCAEGPEALRNMGLLTRLQEKGIQIRWKATLCHDAHKPASDLDAVTSVGKKLAGIVRGLVEQNRCFVVLGGDHSCAVGSWSGVYHALASQAHFGLIWIDAHMDSHLPETSPSGALHGMPLACLLGHGPEALTGLALPGPAVSPQHICLVGVRSFETSEADLLNSLNIKVFYMEEVTRRGLTSIMNDALDIVRSSTQGFGISIDLDGIDPEDAPAVATPVANGLAGDELATALYLVRQQSGLLGIEIAEYNPYLDKEDKTARLIERLLGACLGGEKRP